MQKSKETALVWFRNNLRVTDNTALSTAVNNHQKVVAYVSVPASMFDLHPLGFKKTSYFRAKFLLESIKDLKAALQKLNISLLVSTNELSELTDVCDKYTVSDVYLQQEWTRDEKEQEEHLPKSVTIHRYYDQFLFHPDDIPMSIENLPEIFTVFRKTCEKQIKIRPCTPMPKAMPPKNLLENVQELPSLGSLGFEKHELDPNSAFPFQGGISAANERLNHYFWKSKRLSYYKKTRNGLIGADYSSKFSPWLANGSFSAKEIYWSVKEYEGMIEKNQSTYWLIFELIWRDYFKFLSLKHTNRFFLIGGIKEKLYSWSTNKRDFALWVDGTTHEPFVNANMIELKKTGFMSNRGRQNVASFLSKQMKIDWRWGAEYFEAMLIDYDVHSNYGNWMYNAGVGNDPRDRVFNVRLQAERYDPNSKYQNLWLQNTLF
jgi:deoxyribodipyrimidine photo-lyase